MAFNLNGARPEQNHQRFVGAVISPLVAAVMRPREAFGMPAVPSLHVQTERLRRKLALAGKGLCFVGLPVENPLYNPAARLRHNPPRARASDRQSPPHAVSESAPPYCAPAFDGTARARRAGVSFSSAPPPTTARRSGK